MPVSVEAHLLLCDLIQLDKINVNAHFTICFRHIDSRGISRTVTRSNYSSICHSLQLGVHTFLEMKWDRMGRHFNRENISCFSHMFSHTGMSKLLPEDDSVFLEDRLKQWVVVSGHIKVLFLTCWS